MSVFIKCISFFVFEHCFLTLLVHLAAQPWCNSFSAKALTWPDEWTATTADGKRSAQFEHTLLVTADGVEALTGKLEGSPMQFWERESKVHKGYWLGNTPDALDRAASMTAKVLGAVQ